jgi:hypothetical protein
MMRCMNSAPLGTALVALGLFVVSCGGSSNDGSPATVPVASCSDPFTACGGDVTGTWTLGAFCIAGSLDAALDTMLADYPSCANAFSGSKMTTQSSVTYSGSNFTRTGSIQITGTMKVTPACYAEQISGATLTAYNCSPYGTVAATRIKGSETGTTTTLNCTHDGTNCNCAMTYGKQINETGTYSVTGSTITETGGTNATYQYCVNGNQLAQSGTLGSGMTTVIAGVAQLTK